MLKSSQGYKLSYSPDQILKSPKDFSDDLIMYQIRSTSRQIHCIHKPYTVSKPYQVVSLSLQPTPSFHLHKARGEYRLFCPKKKFTTMIISSELHV